MYKNPLLFSFASGKRSTLLLLTLVAFGLLGNYFKYQIFLNIDFIFGSIFAILALQLFGIGRGILAAALISSYTCLLWNHPYAVIIMTAEVAAVGWLVERRRIGLVLADMIYWFVLGMPLAYLFYHVVMQVPSSSAYIIITKQAVNGITNVLIARLIFTGYTLLSRTSLMSYREIVYNLLTSFVLFPALIILMNSSRTDFFETEIAIKSSLVENIEHEELILDDWASDRRTAVVSLARLAAEKTSRQMQPYLEQTVRADQNFLRVGLLDREATTTAYFPLTDDLGNSNIGKNFAERPYVPVLKRTLKPMLSEVVMGKMTPVKPIVTMLAPVVVKGEYGGYIAGILNLEQVKRHLEKSMNVNHSLYTLVDSSSRVIMTNRTDQKVTTPFDRGAGTLEKLDERIGHWIPELPPYTHMPERWKKSFYFAESGIGVFHEWKLILEQPVAPFQEQLFDRSTNRFILLLVILIGALVLAEVMSRRIVSSLEQLNLITRRLPVQIMNNADVAWPESTIYEVSSQIENFRETADALGQQFQEIQNINSTLEERVEERTKALAESEYFFKESQRAAFIGSYKADFKTGYWESSEVMDSIFGIDRNFVRSIPGWLDLVHPDDRDMISRYLNEEVILNKKPFSKEYRIIRKADGEPRRVYGSGEATFGSSGDIISLIGTIQDVTERMLEREKLHTSENIISQLLQSTDQSIYGIDQDGRCTFINNAGLNLLGYAIEDCLGVNMHNLIHYTKPDGSLYPDEEFPVLSVIKTGISCRHDDLMFWRKDGTSFPSECSARPVIENGKIVGAVIAITDTTERKRHEREKQLLERQFQEAQKYECFGVLAVGIAHDFNNILAIITGQSTLAKMDPANIQSYAKEVEKASARGAELCRQLLIYSGKMDVIKSVVDMMELVDEMVNLLKATIPPNIEISFESRSETLLVHGDATQIRQVVMNLVINASEAIGAENGNIKIVLTHEVIDEHSPLQDVQFNKINPDRYVCLEITDNGSGMTEVVMRKFFEPFYTTKPMGRGLGTSAMLGAVKSHNGALLLHSVPGQGTTFKVLLSQEIPADAIREKALSELPSEFLRGCGTILLVDDEDVILLSVSYMLRKLGFTVIEAKNGDEALTLFRQNFSDIVLVLSDIGMPGINGYDLFREFKKMTPQLPIVLSSGGHADPALISQIEENGLAGLLYKPYSFEELQVVLKNAIEQSVIA